jgi:hypothetical protein
MLVPKYRSSRNLDHTLKKHFFNLFLNELKKNLILHGITFKICYCHID